MRLPFHDFTASDADSATATVCTSGSWKIDDSDKRVIEETLRRHLESSKATIQQVEKLTDCRYPRLLLRLSNGSELMLRLGPAPCKWLLRHEHGALEAEGQILDLLRGELFGKIPVARCLNIGSPRATITHSILTTYVPGQSLRERVPFLTQREKEGIYFELGTIVRKISQHKSSSFGPAASILLGSGSKSWRDAFASLMEAILRDAEDMLVLLPYEQIRELTDRFIASLEEVTESHLLLVSVGDPSNIMLDPKTNKLSSLVDFSSCLWGDVFMSDCFSSGNSAFLKGFGAVQPETPPSRCRQLLYACYRSLVAIVTNHYRPGEEHFELEQRKILTSALNQLATQA